MWFRTRSFLRSEATVAKLVRNKSGFTLLEVMVAVAILAIATVTLLGAQSQSVSIAASARFDTMASLLAQWKMSDLLLQDFDQLVDDEGNFGEDYPHFSWNLRVSELTERDTGIPEMGEQLKTLDVTVRSDQDDNAGLTLRTFVYRNNRLQQKTIGDNEQRVEKHDPIKGAPEQSP
jgi:general secretion pathway protein I